MQKEYLTPTLQILATNDVDVITSSAVLDDGTDTKDHVIVGGWSDAWK
ncbi:MAG: hypothetical protein IKA40_01745 [Clostridia bacterium]|nr:hypothetical protein [Clostridia bacterium]